LIEAKYVNGRKVLGRRELSAPNSWLASLREYFGKKKLVSLKHSDLEDFKSHLADKPVRATSSARWPRSIANWNSCERCSTSP
jgi:hypothetical protein